MDARNDPAADAASRYFAADEDVSSIYRIEGAGAVALLVVNDATVPCGVMPLSFPPSRATGADYPLVVVELSPQEFEEVERGALDLPDGWSVADELPRPEPVVAALAS